MGWGRIEQTLERAETEVISCLESSDPTNPWGEPRISHEYYRILTLLQTKSKASGQTQSLENIGEFLQKYNNKLFISSSNNETHLKQ